MPEERHMISLSEAAQLGQDGVAELVKSIRKAPAKSGLTLSIAEFRALTGYQKGLFLAKTGKLTRPKMKRADFQKLSPRDQSKFCVDGGRLTD